MLDSSSYLKYDVHWIKGDGLANEPSIEVFIGASTNINDCISIGLFQMIDAGIIGKKLITSIDLTIHREPSEINGGYFSKANVIHYETDNVLIGDISEGYGLLNTVGGNLYPQAFKTKTNGITDDIRIDWTSVMNVHFRVKKDGELLDQTENKVRITGHNTNP